MVIFTAIAVAAAIGVEATSFIATAVAFTLNAAVTLAGTYALNYVAQALSGTAQSPATQNNFGVQGQLNAGGDVPRAFGLGQHVTAGSLVYANTWGSIGGGGSTAPTPNAFFTQVIAVSDLPGEQLIDVWVNGEKVTLDTSRIDPNLGTPVVGYYTAGIDHLWIKYYDGTQTTGDGHMVSTVASADRPYPLERVGFGVAYVIATALTEDTLFTGFPTFKFVLSGIPLYDPSQDDTNGGTGSHRYSDPTTWGGDGDQLTAVQAYNVLRGIRYNGAWLYGLQNMTSQARLPAANWVAQIAKCRATVVELDGPQPTYRSGGQINVDTQPANAVVALLTACQGRLSEIGGFYKIHLGEPDSPSFSWSDADLLSSEQQVFRPFFSLADSVNGIQGTYPDPAQGWETATAPPLYRTDLEVRDGSRRLMAAPTFDFVPYPEQVQRLQKSGIEEAQRARTHVLSFPPAFWVIEPGDVGTWSSDRNGYADKLFRVDQVADRANLDVIMNVTEVDPADYDWDHPTDYTPVTTGPTVFPRVPPQGVIDWFAEGTILYDADGLGRRVAIRIAWDGTQPGVVGVQYEVRLAADLSSVTRGRTDQLAVGALLISQGLIPLTAYQVRGQYLPSSPRNMLWSDWLDVTTPEEPVADIPAWITTQVTTVMDQLNDRLLEVEQRLSQVTATNGQRNWLDTQEVRSQISSRSDAAFAEIAHVESVSTSADAAMASDISTLTTSVGDNTANISTNASAIATLDGYAAAGYSVTLDVAGNATGFQLINGGPGFSFTKFTTDTFQISAPGVSGGAAVDVFDVLTVGGVAKVALKGDMYATGTIAGTAVVTGSLTATQIQANSITADRLVTGTITSASGKIGALSLDSLSIADNAATVPQFHVAASQYIANVAGGYDTADTMTFTVDTTGLAGKPITINATWWAVPGANNSVNSQLGARMSVNGTVLVESGRMFYNVSSTNNFTVFMSLSAVYSTTASGGVMTFTILVEGFCTAAGGVGFLAGRNIGAVAAKR
jgi:hypothetical protein